MPKTAKSPAAVLNALLNEYNLNPYSLSKEIKLSASAVRLLVIGKSKITVSTALRLSKYFGNPPSYWLDLQRGYDLLEASLDRKLQTVLKGIEKAKKPAAKKAGTAKKYKAGKRAATSKKVTIKDKRKTSKRTSAKTVKKSAAGKGKRTGSSRAVRRRA